LNLSDGDVTPVATQTPISKKQKSPPKSTKSGRSKVDTVEVPLHISPEKKAQSVALPSHYQRIIDDFRILDETLSIFRVKNQIPYFPLLKDNIERVSGRRFTLDNFRQLITASSGQLYKVEYQDTEDEEGRTSKQELVVRAIHDSKEIHKRMTSDQSDERHKLVSDYLQSRLAAYLAEDASHTVSDAYPVRPAELPEKATRTIETTGGCSTPGRNRVLTQCDSVASNGSVIRTPKSSIRRQLSVSASPIIPNSLPQMVTPVKLRGPTPPLTATPMSAKEKMAAVLNRVKAKEAKDVEEAVLYDKEMSQREITDGFDMCINLIVKMNRDFQNGKFTTAKLSTLKKEHGSIFAAPGDIEKWTERLCEIIPDHFEVVEIGQEQVLRYKSPGVKFSVVRKSIEDKKLEYMTSIKE
jgi:hypothetical protein